MTSFFSNYFAVENIALACYVVPGTGTPVHKNRPHHGLVLYTGGQMSFVFSDGKRLKVEGGNIIYLPKGSDYVVEKKENGGCYAINFDILGDVTFESFVVRTKNTQNFVEMFEKTEHTWRKKTTGYMMKCMSELYGIIYSMKREYEAGYISESKSNILASAVSHIHREYTNESMNISYLAQLCSISETYFRRLFFKTYGMSPVKYINNLRIERAKELIKSDMYSICEVALLSGYKDESYFSREFKKATGVCPSKY